MQVAKEAEKRLIRTLEFLKEPQGSTIPTLVKTLNNDQPQFSLKRIVQTLRGCQQSGIVKVSDGRVKLRENSQMDSLHFCEHKGRADHAEKGKRRGGCGGRSTHFSKLDEIHSIGAETKLSEMLRDSDHTRIPECDDDPPPPDSPEVGAEKPKKKVRCKKKKPRCPKKKPKCPKKKPKCPKKKPKFPKKKPKCPKPKPKCPKLKPKCPKPKPKCPKPKSRC